MNAYRTPQIVSPIVWLLALGALLLFLPNSELQAQSSCQLYRVDGSDIQYVRFQGNFARGNVNWFPSSSCASSGGRIRLPGSGVARASSESAALDICDDNLSGRNTVSPDSSAIISGFWVCSNHSTRSSSSSNGGSTYRPKPYVPSGVTLNQSDLRLSAVDGFHSGIQFQRIGHDGVGNPAVIALGLLDAVDVWGTIGGGYEVCFPQPGRIIFIDTALLPRTVSEIDFSYENGFTCAANDRAGQIVLLESEQTPEIADAPTDSLDAPSETASTTARAVFPDHSAIASLENCQIITRYNMHHRASPAGRSKGLVPGDTLLDATERTAEWFYAVYEGRDGWLNMWFLAYFGDCDYPGEDAEEAESSE